MSSRKRSTRSAPLSHSESDEDYSEGGDVAGSSSSSRRTRGNVQYPPTPVSENHPWLRFNPRSEEYRLMQKLITKMFDASRTIDYAILDLVGERVRAERMLTEPWRRFFRITDPHYAPLCVEFFSTYIFDDTNYSMDNPNSITFQLGGVRRSLSVSEFGIAMGIYTEIETHQDIFLNSIPGLPVTVDKDEFWSEISTGTQLLGNNLSKSTMFLDPLHRYMHRVIAHSIAGRKMSSAGVSQRDLFFLYCMIKGEHCNLAWSLAHFFSIGAWKKPSGIVCGGSYVTALARYFGIISNPENIVLLSTLFCHVLKVDKDHLKRMKMIATFPPPHDIRFIHNGQMWVPPPPPAEGPGHYEPFQEEPVSGGPSSSQRGHGGGNMRELVDMMRQFGVQQTNFANQQQEILRRLDDNTTRFEANHNLLMQRMDARDRYQDEWNNWNYNAHHGEFMPRPAPWQWPPQQQHQPPQQQEDPEYSPQPLQMFRPGWSTPQPPNPPF